MRTALLILISVLVAVPEAFGRSRAVAHRSRPWEAPRCTVSTGLPSFGFLHGTTLGRSKEKSNPWENVFTTGLAIGAAPNTLYAARGGAVLESVDGGCTWHVRASVPEALAGRDVQIVTRHPNRIYAYTTQQIVRITYATVERFNLPAEVQRLEVSPADPLHLRAIGVGGTIFESRDGAATWIPVGQVSGAQIDASEFDPTNFDRIILHTGRFGQMAITNNGGRSWTYPQGSWWRVESIEISPADPNVVWMSAAAGLSNPSLYRSTDGGNTFAVAVSFTSFITHSGSGSLAAHPTDPRVLAVPLLTGLGMVNQNEITYIFPESALWEAAWSPAGTLYFIDLQFRY